MCNQYSIGIQHKTSNECTKLPVRYRKTLVPDHRHFRKICTASQMFFDLVSNGRVKRISERWNQYKDPERDVPLH